MLPNQTSNGKGKGKQQRQTKIWFISFWFEQALCAMLQVARDVNRN